jgi:hypothetical protein
MIRLEYYALPSNRDVAHDGWLSTLTIKQLEILLARIWAAPVRGRYGTETAGGTARPSCTKTHMPGHSPPASSKRAGVLDQPSALCLIGPDRSCEQIKFSAALI